MRFTQLDLLCDLEGFRSKPYQDSGGVWTIGYGTTYYPNGTSVRSSDAPLSKTRAKEIMSQNLLRFISSVESLITSKLNDSQFSALVIFAYNIGITNFKKSTLLRLINKNSTPLDIKKSWSQWNHVGGRIVLGLTNRRKKEIELYFS